MKSLRHILIAALTAVSLLVSCSDDDDEVEVQPNFKVETKSVTLSYSEGAQAVCRFISTTDWQITTSANWLSLSKAEGTAGSTTIVISALSANNDATPRTAELTLSSKGLTATISVSQYGHFYIEPVMSELVANSDGDTLAVRVRTNTPLGSIKISWTSADGNWASLATDTAGNSDSLRVITAIVGRNLTGQKRSGEITFSYFNANAGVAQGSNVLCQATVALSQEAAEIPHSTDFSADKRVTLLQQAEVGNGVPLVLMGDGFMDVDIDNGTYSRVMNQAMENFFSEPIMAELRPYFTVYQVDAVSTHGEIGGDFVTAFSTTMEGGGSTYIGGDDETVIKYVDAVSDIVADDALAIVILNSNDYAGTTYFGYTDDQTGKYVDFAIAYCPVIDSLTSERFRQVISHEAAGHGLSKLDDEYVSSGNGRLTESERRQIEMMQSLGWYQNVDLHSGVSETSWADLASNADYEVEQLGAYEGAGTFSSGVYRPTFNSMMRHNNTGFNAPSRRSIFRRVVSTATGASPSDDDFLLFDSQFIGLQDFTSGSNKSLTFSFSQPVFVGRSMR